jgi:putative exosortase-associated protein (TIGR04073 family)
MRIAVSLLAVIIVAALTGCAGPENKFGRGLNNMTALVSGGDIRRSMEQTALWDDPNRAPTTGFVRGFNRAMARTGIGIYEVVTFPLPPYGPLLVPEHNLYPDHSIKTVGRQDWGGLRLPEGPVYPASYKPGLRDNTFMSTDSALGFGGGEVAPMVPGSRFKIFP